MSVAEVNLHFNMYYLRFTAFEKVAFKLLLKNKLGFSLKEAKLVVDAFVNSQPFTIEITNQNDFTTVKKEALILGAVFKEVSSSEKNHHLVIA